MPATPLARLLTQAGHKSGDPLVGTLVAYCSKVDVCPAAVDPNVDREDRVKIPLVLFDSDPRPECLNCPWCRGDLVVELFAGSDLPDGALYVEDLE